MITSADDEKDIKLSGGLQRVALISLIALFLWCLAWEIFLAPLRPGSLLFLKAVPLVFAFRGVSKGSLYTMQWASMLVLLYLMEGAVRVASDPPGPSILMAWVEIFLATIFFIAAIMYVHPAKRAAKAAKVAKDLLDAERVAASQASAQSNAETPK
jgi:uncharacterized membrane protein